jgi:hypothetical protein
MSATLTLYDLARLCRYVTMVARPRFSLRPSSSAVARDPSQPLFAPREASHAVVCVSINRVVGGNGDERLTSTIVEDGTDSSPGVGVALATGQEVLSQLGGDGGPYGWTGRIFAGKELGEV